jgi:hypothetical protein
MAASRTGINALILQLYTMYVQMGFLYSLDGNKKTLAADCSLISSNSFSLKAYGYSRLSLVIEEYYSR